MYKYCLRYSYAVSVAPDIVIMSNDVFVSIYEDLALVVAAPLDLAKLNGPRTDAVSVSLE
jgi:hypothetical protein